jgi:hypothetical protein
MLKMFTGVAVSAAALILAPTAGARPIDQISTVICEVLDESPALNTITQIGGTLMSKGASAEDAALVIVNAVVNYCPWNTPLIKAYADQAKASTLA